MGISCGKPNAIKDTLFTKHWGSFKIATETGGIFSQFHKTQTWGWWLWHWVNPTLPSGKHTKNDGKSPCSMGKPTISMVIFNSYVELPEGNVIWRRKPTILRFHFIQVWETMMRDWSMEGEERRSYVLEKNINRWQHSLSMEVLVEK